MLENIPKNILEYLINELPPYTGLLIIKTDSEGNVIKHHGPHGEYLQYAPETDKPLHEYVPALYSMIPPLVTPMVLNNIKCHGEKYSDIHIVDGDEDEYFIFFVDQNHMVKGLTEALQKINEDRLHFERSKSNTYTQPEIYKVFDDLILEPIDDSSAHVVPPLPRWYKEFFPGRISDPKINFIDTFPFLEVFLIEAEDFWNSDSDGKFKSGIWTESNNGREIFLNAFAIRSDGKKYIIIRKNEEAVDSEQLGFQMAREQKLAYEKLEKAERKLKTLLEYKDKFVSIVSHDLRSPVSAVLGITDMLIRDETELSKLSDFYRDLILNIRDEMLRLLDYNDKLYHWSNLELGNFETVKKETSLLSLIETAERTSKAKFNEKNINFSSNLKEDIYILVDQTLFSQVFNNLISNAVKFTPEKGNISIDVFDRKDDLQIKVTDNGVGMESEKAKDIFSGFARNTTLGTKGEKGTGLGLGIVKKIADAHEFMLDVESDPGNGTSFIITIPK